MNQERVNCVIETANNEGEAAEARATETLKSKSPESVEDPRIKDGFQQPAEQTEMQLIEEFQLKSRGNEGEPEDDEELQQKINDVYQRMIATYHSSKYSGVYHNVLSNNPRGTYGGSYQNKRSYVKSKLRLSKPKNECVEEDIKSNLKQLYYSPHSRKFSTNSTGFDSAEKPSKVARRLLDNMDPNNFKNAYFMYLQKINKQSGNQSEQFLRALKDRAFDERGKEAEKTPEPEFEDEASRSPHPQVHSVLQTNKNNMSITDNDDLEGTPQFQFST